MTYEWSSPTSAVVRTFDCVSASRNDCLKLLGWFEGAIEICGGVTAHANETSCSARGARACEYTCAWSNTPAT